MEAVLDFARPLDLPLLENVVLSSQSPNNDERRLAENVMMQFKEHPDSWTRVDAILEQATRMETKFFALQVLDQLINTRWKILPREQCEGIKNFIVAVIIKLSSDDRTMQEQRLFLKKLDITLVQIVKQDWPQKWPSFISDLVGSSKTSESLCENNMAILQYLSEEIFDFSAEQMVSQKVKDLKNQLCGEFSQIFHLCMLILETAQKPALIRATLETLLRFLNWIPLGYIFETNLIRLLIEKFFGVPMFRNVVMKCLTEIGSLSVGNIYDEQFKLLFIGTIQKLMTFLPLDFNLKQAYERGSAEETRFVQDLANFLAGFMREHIKLVETPDNQMVLFHAHQYLLMVSEVEEREVFKVCLEYWNKLVNDMYNESSQHFLVAAPLLGNNSNTVAQERARVYAPILSKLRLVMINHMAKPEEVLIVENDVGEIVREFQKDTDSITLYKSMRECLIYLTHLDPADMENIMLDKLAKQVDRTEWSWNNLNQLCWAIGSISGAINEEDEKRFLVTVIKELLGLCEMVRGKDNKAVVASNIMYVVGQYPRFLKAHWKFLKTVVHKLFEFMHELHEGVQDMACDTFIKIAQKCRKHFVIYQIGELVPFIEEILTMLPSVIADLQPQQVHTFYEAVGYMIQAQTDKQVQERLIFKFMELPNSAWDSIIQQVAANVQILREPEKLKSLANVLKTNVSACSAIGQGFVVQLGRIFMDMLNLYKVVSEIISAEVLRIGPTATQHQFTRSLRAVKKETLRLLDTFISKNEDPRLVSETFVPPMLQVISLDYANNPPQAREPDVLNLMATCVEKLDVFMMPKIPGMLDAVFECTVDMICRDFSEFPEHRVAFFRFIREVNAHTFAALTNLPSRQFDLFMNSIVWAFKHTMRDIGETGLQIVYELLGNVQAWQTQNPAGAAAFYQSYFLSLMQDIFVVLTDREHKSGFKMQSMILAHLFQLVENGQVNAPLWKDTQPPTMTNSLYLRDHVINLLHNAFPHLTLNQIQSFVVGMFSLNTDIPAFKSALRDFLIQLKEFSGQDNQDLFVEETEADLANKRRMELENAMRIPGMIRPQDRPEFNMMD